MGAFVLAGARQKIGDQEGGDEPRHERDLECTRRAARREGDRNGGEHDQAAEQTRRDEGAMAAGRQHIRLHQSIEMSANRREQTHVPCARLQRDALPFLIGRSCQRPLKRTLRWRPGRGAGRLLGSRARALRPHSHGMVNGRLPEAGAAPARSSPMASVCKPYLRCSALKSNAGEIRIIQILGKNAAYSTRIWVKSAVPGEPRLQRCPLGCARTRPDRTPRMRGRRMRFLLRMTFWLGVIAVLLPRGESAPASSAQISPIDAMSAATATVGDMRQFCERQAEACSVGSQAAVALGDRAKAGAKRLYEMLNERLPSNETDGGTTASAAPSARAVPLPTPRPSPHGSQNAPPHAAQSAPQNTLTPADLAPTWRSPPPRKDPHERPA